jgi:hypothetical protein
MPLAALSALTATPHSLTHTLTHSRHGLTNPETLTNTQPIAGRNPPWGRVGDSVYSPWGKTNVLSSCFPLRALLRAPVLCVVNVVMRRLQSGTTVLDWHNIHCNLLISSPTTSLCISWSGWDLAYYCCAVWVSSKHSRHGI